MKNVLRFLRFCLWTLLVLVASGGALFGYYVYAPAPEIPRLSGTLSKGSIEVDGLQRAYLTYRPRGLPRGAPLVVAMHGSGQVGADMRKWTGYGFERLADEHGFAVVYPDGYEGYWNACNIVGDYSANKRGIDDVRFLTRLADKLVAEDGIDRGRVFAIGISRGGSMALRLALEAPSRFRAVAEVSESVPTPDNFKCRPAERGSASVMIMNGTKDPIVPFDGGEVEFFGLLKRGKIRSSLESARYLADLNLITGAPQTSEVAAANGIRIERMRWHNDSGIEVELVAIHGGGHGIPQPYWRRPRLLGPSPSEPDGPAMVWEFFARQRP